MDPVKLDPLFLVPHCSRQTLGIHSVLFVLRGDHISRRGIRGIRPYSADYVSLCTLPDRGFPRWLCAVSGFRRLHLLLLNPTSLSVQITPCSLEEHRLPAMISSVW